MVFALLLCWKGTAAEQLAWNGSTVRRVAAALRIPSPLPSGGQLLPAPFPLLPSSFIDNRWHPDQRMLHSCHRPGGSWTEFVADVTAQPRCRAPSPHGAPGHPLSADQLNGPRACAEVARQWGGLLRCVCHTGTFMGAGLARRCVCACTRVCRGPCALVYMCPCRYACHPVCMWHLLAHVCTRVGL